MNFYLPAPAGFHVVVIVGWGQKALCEKFAECAFSRNVLFRKFFAPFLACDVFYACV